MNAPLQIVHLEDNAVDAALVESILETNGMHCSIHCIKTREEFSAALQHQDVDLILSDFSMPKFDGLSALKMARQQRPEVPFLFLSGTIGEEMAVEALKNGATDYVLKDRMSRLPASVQRAVREAEDSKSRRRMEEELRKSEERFQLAARATNDVVWDWNLLTNETWRNENFQKLFGYTAEEIEPRVDFWRERIDHGHKSRVMAHLYESIRSGQETWSDEYGFLRADGSTAYILDRGYIIRDRNNQPVRMIGAMTDLTQRKQAEEQIRAQAALLDKAQDAICLTDMSQKILYWNKAAERLYGWRAGEALGQNANDLLFQGDEAAPKEAIRNLIRNGEWQGELHQQTRSGRKVTIESRWTLMRDELHEPTSILVINTDVTEKKQFEAQFLRAQRMESIGALAGGIAHDLNNALTPIMMVAELLKGELSSPEARQLLTMMTTSARRGSEMVKQILSFSRGVGGQKTEVEVDALIREVARMAEDTFPPSIKIRTIIMPGLSTVLGNSTQLHQVLLNLCVNARDAMPGGGLLTIGARNLLPGEENFPKSLKTGAYVLLQVSDTGHGIAPELMEKIFEPFFTTKELGKGTGLGLSTVMGIVKTHGGVINVSSEVGRGTTFRVYLPAKSTRKISVKEPTTVAKGNGEQILVVDDEAAVLELTKITLEAFNYQVLAAHDGIEALAMYRQQKDEIKLALVDMLMPGMSGQELVLALHEENPRCPIICMSGLNLETTLQESRKLNVAAFVKKPFATEELLEELEKVINSKQAS
jgi:PAS domain S-box-containing protein